MWHSTALSPENTSISTLDQSYYWPGREQPDTETALLLMVIPV